MRYFGKKPGDSKNDVGSDYKHGEKYRRQRASPTIAWNRGGSMQHPGRTIEGEMLGRTVVYLLIEVDCHALR